MPCRPLVEQPTKYERSCARINPTLVRLLRPARSLPRFRVRPTILASIEYHGQFSGMITTVTQPGIARPATLRVGIALTTATADDASRTIAS